MSRMVEVYRGCAKMFNDYLNAHGNAIGKEKKNLNKQCEFLIFNDIISENKKTPKDLEIPPPK